MPPVRWVFFDIGNILLNDDPVIALVYYRLFEAIKEIFPSISFEDLMAEREELVRTARDFAPFVTLGRKYLGEERFQAVQRAYREEIGRRVPDLYREIPEAREILESLQGKVRLGVIANQPESSLTRLKALDLEKYFEVMAISAVLKLHKPDPRLFQWALDQVGVRPEETLMVGDRVDNDLIPAKKVGMRTLWHQWPLETKGDWAREPYEFSYLSSISRAYSNHLPPQTPEEEPDARAWGKEELASALNTLIFTEEKRKV